MIYVAAADCPDSVEDRRGRFSLKSIYVALERQRRAIPRVQRDESPDLETCSEFPVLAACSQALFSGGLQ
jgi:hypothetical protein